MTPPAPRAHAPESLYLDHAAATPLVPGVVAAMDEVRGAAFANPSSPHADGRRARRVLEDARERILALLGPDVGPGARLVFTSGATEANRLGLVGLAAGPRGRVLRSARDHASVAAAAGELEARGWTAATVPLRPDGTLRLTDVPTCPDQPEVLCVTIACGQSGTCEDMEAVATWAAARGGRLVHADATQAVWMAAGCPGVFGPSAAAATTLVLAPHKFGGPRGIGGLVIRSGVTFVPPAAATQEAGVRGGTEAVTLAAGFARAVELAVVERDAVALRMATLRDRLEGRLVAAARAAGLEARPVAGGGSRAPHVSTIAFVGLDRQAIVMAADLAGVSCASGTACASGASDPSPALVAMGLPAGHAAGAVRFSLGRETTTDVVDAAAERIGRVLVRMAAARHD